MILISPTRGWPDGKVEFFVLYNVSVIRAGQWVIVGRPEPAGLSRFEISSQTSSPLRYGRLSCVPTSATRCGSIATSPSSSEKSKLRVGRFTGRGSCRTDRSEEIAGRLLGRGLPDGVPARLLRELPLVLQRHCKSVIFVVAKTYSRVIIHIVPLIHKPL